MDQSPNPNRPGPLKPNNDAALETPGADATRLADSAPPLTPAAWLANNAIYLVAICVAIGALWYNVGLGGVWAAAKVVVGIGFVIFIHELGHFLAAKWCDVHVQTFSIGFGPALPGCSFQRGETTYKLAVLPLGGYVNMIGEGLEEEEDESYPRSFKNKTVGQRMLIISAGVIMNVLLGCVLFIVVYYYHGIRLPPAVVGRVDPAGVLWTKGIRSGTLITNLDGIDHPSFKNLQRKVILSAKGEELPFTLQMFDNQGEATGTRTVQLTPRSEANDLNPVVGVAPPVQLRLWPKPEMEGDSQPVAKGSPADAARPLPVNANEIIIASTDPDNPDSFKDIPRDPQTGTPDYRELSRRVLALRGQKMMVRVVPKEEVDKAKPVEREVPLEGFQWSDTILGCTEVQDPRSYDPFRIGELPRDPRHADGERRDPFVFVNRLRQLLDVPIVVQVRRGSSRSAEPDETDSGGPIVNLFVPPAYHITFGMRMKMGKVAGVREGSAAALAGVQKDDELIKVVLADDKGRELQTWAELDPERLPFELAQVASRHHGKKRVILTVRREGERAPKDIACPPVEWDESWDNDRETPLGPGSPLAIPQLGVAYWVMSQIVEVKPGSPAEKAGLQKGDTLKQYRLRERSEYSKELSWSKWLDLGSKRNGSTVYDRWALPFTRLQLLDNKEIAVKLTNDEEKHLTPVDDPTWPLATRGISLIPDYTLQKAHSLSEALVMGGRETRDMLGIMYLQLRSLATGRISFKGVSGPIGMGMEGFAIAQTNNYVLLSYLSMISINLAVVNFLPIPILDGGHMVFLIYEKLRGRPPTEKVRAIATYIGLAMIGFLMLFVFYQDIQHYILGWVRG